MGISWPRKQTLEPALEVWKELNSISMNISLQCCNIVFMGCLLMRLCRSIDLSYSIVLASECSIMCRKSLKEFKIVDSFEDLQFRERNKIIKRILMAF